MPIDACAPSAAPAMPHIIPMPLPVESITKKPTPVEFVVVKKPTAVTPTVAPPVEAVVRAVPRVTPRVTPRVRPVVPDEEFVSRVDRDRTPPPPAPRAMPSPAALYGEGQRLYRAGKYEAAVTKFAAAAQADDDARFWYFKGLAEAKLGLAASKASLNRGAELHEVTGPDAPWILDAIAATSSADQAIIQSVVLR